jgi:hypothetical protein
MSSDHVIEFLSFRMHQFEGIAHRPNHIILKSGNFLYRWLGFVTQRRIRGKGKVSSFRVSQIAKRASFLRSHRDSQSSRTGFSCGLPDLPESADLGVSGAALKIFPGKTAHFANSGDILPSTFTLPHRTTVYLIIIMRSRLLSPSCAA